jgi:hypothetical protein
MLSSFNTNSIINKCNEFLPTLNIDDLLLVVDCIHFSQLIFDIIEQCLKNIFQTGLQLDKIFITDCKYCLYKNQMLLRACEPFYETIDSIKLFNWLIVNNIEYKNINLSEIINKYTMTDLIKIRFIVINNKSKDPQRVKILKCIDDKLRSHVNASRKCNIIKVIEKVHLLN